MRARSVLLSWLPGLAGVAVVACCAACSSGGGTCHESAGSADAGAGGVDLCARSGNGGGSTSGGLSSSGGASSSGTLGASGSGSGGSSGASGSGSGSGGSGSSGATGSGSGSGGSGSSGASGGGSGGGENCQDGQGDFCLCYGASSSEPANGTPCSPSSLKDPGVCCADPGFPGSGDCICSSFLCYVNSGGGKDCWYQDLDGNGLEVPTTSASGTACCTWGDSTNGYICSCYDDAGLCEGKTTVSSCTSDTIPACSSLITTGYTQVPACR
ncbi:MAG TPA: hypothetical protein VIY73_03135 [Polyangiaceae bacterium]